MGKAWERYRLSASGHGQDFPYQPNSATVEIGIVPVGVSGTVSLLRTIITGCLTVIPDSSSPAIPSSWPGRSQARLVAALSDPSEPWPPAYGIFNSEILGFTTLLATALPPTIAEPNGAGIFQTPFEIDLHGMRDLSKYPTTPELRIGGQWLSEDVGGLLGVSFTWTWLGTVSVLWGTSG